jgi:lysophospholipase L1-like esterase
MPIMCEFESGVWSSIHARLRAGEKTRLLAFGSSNTERHLPGMHWLDVVELALRRFGRIHHCINAGICGNTSQDLLARFETDAAFYRPHVAIITIGGNDAMHAERALKPDAFEANLRELSRRFSALECAVVFQTYYSPDPARNGDLGLFFSFMNLVRHVARETGAGLIDHLRRWEAFRKAHPERYLPLMQDGFHLNWRGNMVLGLDTARAFAGEFDPGEREFWRDALEIQRLMDEMDPGCDAASGG